jgi:hypothetical protein
MEGATFSVGELWVEAAARNSGWAEVESAEAVIFTTGAATISGTALAAGASCSNRAAIARTMEGCLSFCLDSYFT